MDAVERIDLRGKLLYKSILMMLDMVVPTSAIPIARLRLAQFALLQLSYVPDSVLPREKFPTDPFTGEPLLCEQREEDLVLYSTCNLSAILRDSAFIPCNEGRIEFHLPRP